MKLITIIIATYNAEKYLQSCIDSIISQKKPEIELIIIDGGSNDETLKIIKNNRRYIDHFSSESDKGIYDAWNKGISKSQGDWIMFLGADDELLPDSINCYLSFLRSASNTEYDLISSKIQMIDSKGNKIRVIGYPYKWPQFLYTMLIAHPGALHSRKLFDIYGFFDVNYKIVGDYEFLLRAEAKLKTSFIDHITVIMREGGASDTIKAIWEAHKAVCSKGAIRSLHSFFNASWITIKFLIKKSARKFGLNIYISSSYFI